MAQSVYSYSDVIRLTAKSLATSSGSPQPDVKTYISHVSKAYTALSKHLNYLLKKYLEKQVADHSPSTLDLEVPFFGTISAQGPDSLTFTPSNSLADDSGMLAPTPKFEGSKKHFSSKQDINMGKIAEVSMMSREQVKTIISQLSTQIVSSRISPIILIGWDSQTGVHGALRFQVAGLISIQNTYIFKDLERAVRGKG